MNIRILKQKDFISQQLLHDILSGNIRTSESGKMPSAADLSRRYGVSVITFREILKSMESFGILSIQHGRGIFLENRNTITDELFEARILVESRCASLAAQKRTGEELQILRSIFELLKGSAGLRDMEGYTDADYEFHFTIAKMSRNRILEKTLQNIKMFLLYQQLETNKSLLSSLEHSVREHQRILEGISMQDQQLAASAMKEHLLLTKGLWTLREQDPLESDVPEPGDRTS